MQKRSILFVVGLLLAILVVGCGGSGSNAFGGDILRDKAATKKAVEEMKKRGGGEPLMIFQSVNFNSDFINFNRRDPKKPDNVDNFVWTENTGWQGPKAVVLKGGGDMDDNVFNADDVNWEAIPDFIVNVEKKAKEEGMEKIKIDGMMVYFNVSAGKLSFTTTVKSDRKEASVSGDVKTGEVTSFRFR